MIKSRMQLGLVVAALAGAAALAGCASSPQGPAGLPAPIIKNVNELQGATVEVPLNSSLVVNTESLPVDSYSAEIADPAVLEFVQGGTDGSATFNPGFRPLEVGETEVTMTNEQGGIQPLEFTVVVTE